MKKTVKIISGILASIIALSSISVYAYDKYVEKVNFKIVLNNREVELPKDIDIVTINDSTYLPLRALCETVMGLDVIWHGDTQVIEMWNITKPEDRGSHEVPIPLGAGVSGEFQAKDKSYVQYDFAIEDIIRGSEAYSKAENWYKQVEPFEYNGDNSDAKKRKEAQDKYDEKVLKYMNGLIGGSDFELLIAKVHMDIKPSASSFEYKTNDSDLTPYCGTVTVQGNQRQFVEYSVPSSKMPSDLKYGGRTILTNGIQEGYIIFRVYKNDEKPRIMYKDGQYLALYR